MNERIKQLWEEAAKTNQGDSWQEQTKFMEKFAELIVKECIDKAEEESERYLSWGTEDCDRFAKVMRNYKELLKEHFGVE